jgi:hypothetical protein
LAKKIEALDSEIAKRHENAYRSPQLSAQVRAATLAASKLYFIFCLPLIISQGFIPAVLSVLAFCLARASIFFMSSS